MKTEFENLDAWEDVHNRRSNPGGLVDCAVISTRGAILVARDVMKDFGQPKTVKVQRLIKEGMLFIRLLPHSGIDSRAVVYGANGNQSPTIQAATLLPEEHKKLLPLKLQVVRVGQKEAVFVGVLKGEHEQ